MTRFSSKKADIAAVNKAGDGKPSNPVMVVRQVVSFLRAQNFILCAYFDYVVSKDLQR